MKLLPRLPEVAGQSDLTPEEKNQLWPQICRETPMSVFWLAVSMVVAYEVALTAADDYFHFASLAMVAFMIAAMATWAWAAAWTAVHYLYLPRLKRAVERVSRNRGRFEPMP